jgi:hypothetical protein
MKVNLMQSNQLLKRQCLRYYHLIVSFELNLVGNFENYKAL